jgi:hypothetical protein
MLNVVHLFHWRRRDYDETSPQEHKKGKNVYVSSRGIQGDGFWRRATIKNTGCSFYFDVFALLDLIIIFKYISISISFGFES